MAASISHSLRFHEIFFSSFSLCLPPRLQPPPIVDGGDLPEVTVLVGTKLRYQIGYVRYNGGEEEFISSEVIGAISAITAILVSIGIVVLIVLKHKSTQVINLIIWVFKLPWHCKWGTIQFGIVINHTQFKSHIFHLHKDLKRAERAEIYYPICI